MFANVPLYHKKISHGQEFFFFKSNRWITFFGEFMAIAFAHVSIHSRSKGHSALAASSYRAGVRLFDARTGETHDFSNRQDVTYSEILLPDNANEAFLDREYLWNTVEAAEKRKDAQLCKDIVLALPKELNREQQIELAKRFAQTHFVANGLPADIALHDHGDGNPHVHILIPTRRLEQDRFSKYKARDLNPAFAKGFVVEKDFWGEQWRDMQNTYFQEHNIDLAVDLNHVIPEQHRGRHRQSQSHYLREENQLIDEVRRDIARGQVGVFIKHLSTKHSVFTRRDVEKLLFKTFRDSDDSQEYLRVMERILGHKEIVFLGKNDRGHDSFTTREQYRLEAHLHKDVEALMSSRQHSFATPDTSLAAQYNLSDEQNEALRHIIESPDISVVIGRPGTGKSYLLQPVKEYYEAQQQHIIGASLSGKVAKALQTETGIPSSTIASLIWKISNDRLQLTDKHVLVVDEAGMVDVHNMAFLLREARKAGSKVILIGDPDQLKPIHKGEIFRGVAALTGYIELENIKRQQDAGDRQASRDLAKGNIQEAVQHYHDKQAVIISEHAIDDLLNDWEKALHTEAVRDTVLLAFSRKSVLELNTQARERLQTQNKIGHENIAFEGFERELNISSGDRLLFRENNKTLGLRNGDIGTVKYIHQSGYQVELDSGEQLNVPREYQAMDYGYALTVHKSQGMTTKHAKVLIDSKYWDRNLSFVAFTRHKETLKIYTDTMNHTSRDELVNTLSRRSIRDNVIDWPLDYATRCGFNPDKLVGRVLNQLVGVGHQIKQRYNFIVHYEDYLCRQNTKCNYQKTHAKTYATSLLQNKNNQKTHQQDVLKPKELNFER
jgi:Ti-type conjugative transfer relaxase TraA